MEDQKLGYQLRIGQECIYQEIDGSQAPCPGKLINIFHDGHYVIYEFQHDSGAIGATIYPQTLKPKK